MNVSPAAGCYPSSVAEPSHPRLSRYLASLPQGVDSHPECTVRAATMHAALDLLDLEDAEGLPGPVREVVLDPPHRSRHIPEVHNLAFFTWLRDERFEGDEGYLTFTDAVFHRFYAMPLYRLAFMMGRPDQIASASTRIWGWIRSGTSLELVSRGEAHVDLRVRYPDQLFDALHARVLARGLAVAYRLAHSYEELSVTPGEQTPSELLLEVRWS